MAARGSSPAAEAQRSKGLVPGTKFYSAFPFSGMNLQASAIAIDDREFLWVENFVRLGDGKLRTLWDVGAAVYTSPAGLTIVHFFFFNIGTIYYVAVFLSDGSAVQVHVASGSQIPIGPPGLFYVTNGEKPACAQWGTLYLLISNNNTPNDYWAWDGALLYGAGTAAPGGVNILASGANYNIAPSIVTFGGHGSGMAFATSVNAGGVVEINITNPGTGYEVGDIVQLAFTGGGSDTSAILQANLTAGGVAAANITAPGSGYTTATVAFSGGGGSGATATATIGSGLSTVTVTSMGSGYTGANVSVSGGAGSGAIVDATVNGGQVTALTIIDPGTGYTGTPSLTITGDGTGAAGTAAVNAGEIVAITITSPGTGYTSAPSITITGDGTGALAVSLLGGGSVQGVTVVNPGSGFFTPPKIKFVGGGGSGATGYALLVPTSVATINVIAGGSNYQYPPEITVAGGPLNVGIAKATAVVADGAVIAINVTNAGSQYAGAPYILFSPKKNDNGTYGGGAAAEARLVPSPIGRVQMTNYGQNYTDAPTVEVQSGANNAAYATVDLMPFGISGTTIETFQSRAWLGNPAQGLFEITPPGGNFSVSAAGGFIDFAPSDGGVFFTNSDGFLQTKYVSIRQSNGYLYFFADGSVSVVSNIQTSGNPVVTTFNYQNVDPQTGVSWVNSHQDFSRTLIVANETGVYGLYGGAMTPLAKKLDDLFVNAAFPPTPGALIPSAAVATIFNVKHYLLMMTVLDPDLGTHRNIMATWNEREWTMASQTPALIQIGTQKVGSKFTAWGTDGQKLYPMFSQPSANLVKRLDTKAYGAPQTYMVKQLDSFYTQATDMSVPPSGITLQVSYAVSGLAVQSPDPVQDTIPSGFFVINQPPQIATPQPFFGAYGATAGDIPFVSVSARITTTSPDFVLGNLVLSYLDNAANR